MAKVSKVKSVVEIDQTLPRTSVTLGGKQYHMCLDLGALAKAERELNEQGHEVSLLFSLPPLNLSSLRIVFGASLRTFHPEIAYDDALQLLKLAHVQKVSAAIIDVWNKSLAEPEEGAEANPIEPDGEKP